MNSQTDEKRELKTVPFIAYESLAVCADRINKRLTLALIGTVVACVAWSAVCLVWKGAKI